MSWWVKTLNFILKPWPRHWVRALGKPLGFLWFDFLRFRREVVLNNLKIAFPDWTDEKRLQVGRRSVYVLMENFFEFFLIPSISESWIEKNVVLHGEDNIKQALSQKRGVLIMSLHLGNGDLMSNIVCRLGYRLHVITKFFKSEWLNKIWFAVRGAQGVKYIEPHGERTPFAILKALKANELVGFVLDQHMGRPYGVETHFFGKKAGTAYGLALFHLKTKSPIVPMYTFEGEDGRVHVMFEKAFQYDESYAEVPDRDLLLKQLTQKYTDKIEEIVRTYPNQWMWVHRRWKWKG